MNTGSAMNSKDDWRIHLGRNRIGSNEITTDTKMVPGDARLDTSYSNIKVKLASNSAINTNTRNGILDMESNSANDSKSNEGNHSTQKSKFKRYEKVAIVTKIHSPKDVYRLKKMLCLLDVAYNQYVNYDIIVFTTKPWTKNHIKELQNVIPNTKIEVVIDGPSSTGNIDDYIVNMTQDEISNLEERCGTPLGWSNLCVEQGPEYTVKSSMAYNWQSEFRAYHIFKHPALRPFKYMFWMDSDALCTQEWTIDTMKIMVDNDLTIFFANFPAGKTEEQLLRTNIEKVYNQSICHAILNKQGFLWARKCNDENSKIHIQHIHGFHHITNLDVYRKEEHLKFLHSITEGNYKFSRLWDDQLAVTVPAIMDTPGKAWDYWRHNVTTNIFHHGDLDGKGNGKNIKDFKKFLDNQGSNKWEEGTRRCSDYI